MGRNQNRRKRAAGFSESWLRPFIESTFGRKNKRRSLNQIATLVALCIGLLGGAIGGHLFGWTGAVLGFIVGCAAGGAYVTSNRYYR